VISFTSCSKSTETETSQLYFELILDLQETEETKIMYILLCILLDVICRMLLEDILDKHQECDRCVISQHMDTEVCQNTNLGNLCTSAFQHTIPLITLPTQYDN
jgi:hypothetical protein